MNLARALGVTPEARGVASEQFEEIREKADAAVQAKPADPDNYAADLSGSLSSIETPTAEDTLPMRELLGLVRKHFVPGTILYPIFKLSYSCTKNMRSIIQSRN